VAGALTAGVLAGVEVPMSGRRKKQRFAAEERKRRRQFRADERKGALEDLAAGRPPHEVAAGLGCCCETLRLWKKAAEADGTMPVAKQAPGAATRKPRKPIEPTTPPPASNGGPPATVSDQAIVPAAPTPTTAITVAPLVGPSQLGSAEIDAILRFKKRHPSMGPAQIGAQLKRFHGWRVAVRAIARVLLSNGYKLEHRGSRPEGDEVPHRFEAPYRNALWQLDFAELFIGSERRQLLIIEDDFSRFIVGHRLVEHPTSEVAVDVLGEAIRRHGKPEAVYTDRGGAFLAWGDVSSFGTFLEQELIDHHVGHSYHPQGRGKVEAVIHSVRRELWETTHFDSVEAAENGLAAFFREYNHRRAHMGIDGLTPADRFFGRWEEVRQEVEARARRRPLGSDPHITEERLPEDQVEVVRLMFVGDRLELRLLGHTSVLGTTRS
jgi:transposase InsO family protein